MKTNKCEMCGRVFIIPDDLEGIPFCSDCCGAMEYLTAHPDPGVPIEQQGVQLAEMQNYLERESGTRVSVTVAAVAYVMMRDGRKTQ